MSLRISPCRTLCDWGRTPARRREEPLFACTGCGSQWVPSEPWTPRQADGTVPAEVQLALRGACDPESRQPSRLKARSNPPDPPVCAP